MRVDNVGSYAGAHIGYARAFAAVCPGRQRDHRTLDPQGLDKHMAGRGWLVDNGRYVYPVAPGRLGGCEGKDDTLEAAYLAWRNHMENCDIVVCLQHAGRAKVARRRAKLDGCVCYRKPHSGHRLAMIYRL